MSIGRGTHRLAPLDLLGAAAGALARAGNAPETLAKLRALIAVDGPELVTLDRSSRLMFVARLENMQKNGDHCLTATAVLALLNDCDMLSARERPTAKGVLGAAVIVGGVVVAWFANFDEAAQEWCTENHFGQWLMRRAKPPELVPLTEAEYDEVMRQGKELADALHARPEAP
jgi:hypothetical protein